MDSLPVTDFILIHSHIRQFASMMFLSNHPSSMLRMVAVLHYFVTYEKPLSFIGDKPSCQLLQSFFKQQYSHSSCFLLKTRCSSHRQALSGYPPSLFMSQIRSSEQFFVVSTKGNALETDAAFPGIDAMTEIVHNPFFLDHPDAVVDGKDGKQLDVNTVHSPAAGTILGLWVRHVRPLVTVVAIGFQYRLRNWKIHFCFPKRALHQSKKNHWIYIFFFSSPIIFLSKIPIYPPRN